jgi:hypothetical protein
MPFDGAYPTIEADSINLTYSCRLRKFQVIFSQRRDATRAPIWRLASSKEERAGNGPPSCFIILLEQQKAINPSNPNHQTDECKTINYSAHTAIDYGAHAQKAFHSSTAQTRCLDNAPGSQSPQNSGLLP